MKIRPMLYRPEWSTAQDEFGRRRRRPRDWQCVHLL